MLVPKKKLSIVDPQIFSEYTYNGLTYKSDDVNIIPRDSAGNIIIQPSSSMNELLVIEPVVKNITTKSVLRVIDTSFQYYKFPVSTISNNENIDLNIDVDLTDIIPDPIYTRYKPATDFTYSPTGGTYSGILMDEVVEGLPQTNTNCYTISKEAKNSGKDLRFRVKIAHRLTGGTVGTIYWSIMKTGPNTGGLIRDWLGGYASSANSDLHQLLLDVATTMRDLCDDPAKLGGEYNTLNYEEPWISYYRLFKSPDMVNPGITEDQTQFTGNQLDAIDFVLSRDAKKVPRTGEDTYRRLISELNSKLASYNLANQNPDGYGFIYAGETQNTYIDETIPNSEFEIGDIFQIGVQTDNDGHTILNNQTYWVITDASKTVDEWNQEIL